MCKSAGNIARILIRIACIVLLNLYFSGTEGSAGMQQLWREIG